MCEGDRTSRGGCPQTSSFCTHLPAYEDGTECSETSEYKFQTPGNHPKESIQHSVHGESLKSRLIFIFKFNFRPSLFNYTLHEALIYLSDTIKLQNLQHGIRSCWTLNFLSSFIKCLPAMRTKRHGNYLIRY